MTVPAFLVSLLLLVLAVIAQEGGDTSAPVTENNPARVTFQAVLQVSKPVQGQVSGVSSDNGTGVNFNINFYAFPDVSLGPFNYHIHEYPIDPTGNCTIAGGHLSPFGRTETPPCDATNPATCQPGDLSGKHGNISQVAQASGNSGGINLAANTFQTTYLDLYLSTDANNVAFFGNRSLVVHAANGTRLNCANFTQMLPSETFGSGNLSTSTSAPSGTSTSTSTPAQNAAATVVGALKVQMSVVFGLALSIAASQSF